MTRTAAREIAIQLEYRMALSHDDPAVALDEFFEPEYYETLAREDKLFGEYPDEKQLAYIRSLVTGISEHREELNAGIEKYARNWKVGRISKTAASIMRAAMFEIRYLDDVPDAAAINEAVELAKGYEEPETVAFINGVLGSFVRQERGEAPAEQPEELTIRLSELGEFYDLDELGELDEDLVRLDGAPDELSDEPEQTDEQSDEPSDSEEV